MIKHITKRSELLLSPSLLPRQFIEGCSRLDTGSAGKGPRSLCRFFRVAADSQLEIFQRRPGTLYEARRYHGQFVEVSRLTAKVSFRNNTDRTVKASQRCLKIYLTGLIRPLISEKFNRQRKTGY